jgi:hypothetical protein
LQYLGYNWHRFYDPTTGRYISADPIGLGGGINLYGYVNGDPVNKVDPKGLFSPCNPTLMDLCQKNCTSKGKVVKSCLQKGFLGIVFVYRCECGPTDEREKICKDAFLSCLNDCEIDEELCFKAYDTCINTTLPMIFPGYGPIPSA